MYRPITRRLLSRPVTSGLSSKPIIRVARRGYADAHAAAKKSSDMPWLISSVGITVPAAYWLLQTSPAEGHHFEAPPMTKAGEVATDEVESSEEDKKEVEEAQAKEDEKPDLNTAEGKDQFIKGKENVEKGKSEERTVGDRDSPKAGLRGAGKPDVAEDTPHAEQKNSGQEYAESGEEGKPRHKAASIPEKGGNMAKTGDTVVK